MITTVTVHEPANATVLDARDGKPALVSLQIGGPVGVSLLFHSRTGLRGWLQAALSLTADLPADAVSRCCPDCSHTLSSTTACINCGTYQFECSNVPAWTVGS